MAEALPETMTAIAISEPGGPRVLKPETRPVPKPQGGDILVRVRAAGVNRPDVARMNAKFMAVASPIVGEIEVRGVEDGVVVCYIPDCAMHKVVSDTEPQTYACLYGCKAACEAFMGPDDPMTIHFEPNLPTFDCIMRVGAGRSIPARAADATSVKARAS